MKRTKYWYNLQLKKVGYFKEKYSKWIRYKLAFGEKHRTNAKRMYELFDSEVSDFFVKNNNALPTANYYLPTL